MGDCFKPKGYSTKPTFEATVTTLAIAVVKDFESYFEEFAAFVAMQPGSQAITKPSATTTKMEPATLAVAMMDFTAAESHGTQMYSNFERGCEKGWLELCSQYCLLYHLPHSVLHCYQDHQRLLRIPQVALQYIKG